MKLSLQSAIASVLVAAFTGTAQADPPGTVVIRRGTSMQFETEKPLDPTTAKRGDDISVRLIRPLVIDGSMVLPAGFEAHGKVRRKWSASRCAVSWEPVEWNIDQMRMPNGSTVLVQRMFVPHSGLIPDRYDSRYLKARGLKRIGRDIAEYPLVVVGGIVMISCAPFGCITGDSPFLPQQNAGGTPPVPQTRSVCAGPAPVPAHSLVPVAFAKEYQYRP